MLNIKETFHFPCRPINIFTINVIRTSCPTVQQSVPRHASFCPYMRRQTQRDFVYTKRASAQSNKWRGTLLYFRHVLLLHILYKSEYVRVYECMRYNLYANFDKNIRVFTCVPCTTGRHHNNSTCFDTSIRGPFQLTLKCGCCLCGFQGARILPKPNKPPNSTPPSFMRPNI